MPRSLSSSGYDPCPADLLRCRKCRRLAMFRESVAQSPPRRHQGETYWAKPVPGFGDLKARIVLLGLAPGAHGSNRTGRMFTGDASGDFLYPALYRAGLATQPDATSSTDGLELRGVFITAAARCVPPNNKPSPRELENCRTWLDRDLAALTQARVVVALGKVAHDAFIDWTLRRGVRVVKSRLRFAHGAEFMLAVPSVPVLIDSYHVSRQNTNTGKLTPAMFDEILHRAKVLATHTGRTRTPARLFTRS